MYKRGPEISQTQEDDDTTTIMTFVLPINQCLPRDLMPVSWDWDDLKVTCQFPLQSSLVALSTVPTATVPAERFFFTVKTTALFSI